MKNFLKFILVMSLSYACKSETKEIEKAPETENIKVEFIPKLLHEVNGLTHCESVVYDKKRNVLYASLIGNREKGDGSIAKISLDGKIIDSAFISGINDPKGIAITDDKLYVSDVTDLVEADLNTGKIIKKYTTEGVQFLNDVAIGNDGTVYVSDTFKSSIYILKADGLFLEWIASEDLEHPNGLLKIENEIYISAWGNVVGEGEMRRQSGYFLKMNSDTKEISKISKDTLGNLDGVQVYDKEHMLISAWNTGKILKINTDGTVEDVLTVGRSVGDILYIPEKKLLALPMNIQSQLLIYEFQEVTK